MPVPHYLPTGFPFRNQLASSRKMREEFEAVEAGIDVMDCHTISLLIQPWLSTPSVDDWYLAMPFHCQLVGGFNVLLDSNPPSTASAFFYNFTNGNGALSTSASGVNEFMTGGVSTTFGLTTDVKGTVYKYVMDLSDEHNDFPAGTVMRIRCNAATGTTERSVMSLRLRRL